DLRQIVWRVDAPQLLERRFADREAGTGIVISRPLELPEDRLEAFRSLGMRRRHPMIDHVAISEESDDHGSSRGLEARCRIPGMVLVPARILPDRSRRAAVGPHSPDSVRVPRETRMRGAGERFRPDLPARARTVRIFGHELLLIANGSGTPTRAARHGRLDGGRRLDPGLVDRTSRPGPLRRGDLCDGGHLGAFARGAWRSGFD